MRTGKHIGFLAPTAYNYFRGQGFGGAELQVMQLSRLLISAGYEVSVLTNDFGQKDVEMFEDIRIVKAPLRFLGGSNLYFLPDTLRFIKIVKQQKLDWCFFLTPNAALFQLGLANLFCRKMKICKYIASDLDCRKSNSLPGWLYRCGLKMTDAFLFQTCKQQEQARRTLGISGGLLPNIFMPPAARPVPATERDIDILWVGAFDEWKRPDRLYEIAKAMPQYKFTLVCKPVNPAYRELENNIRQLPNVDFVGTVPFEVTQSYFNRAKIYLSTSAVEGFPNTFLQAWWAKSPVLSMTFPCDGILERDNSGRLSGSLEQCIKDVDELMQDRSLRETLGGNGYNYLMQNHSPEATLKRLENLIEQYQ